MGQVFVPLIQLPITLISAMPDGGDSQLLPFCQAATESQLLIQLWFLFSDEGRAVFKSKAFLMPSGSGFRIVALAERTASCCCSKT